MFIMYSLFHSLLLYDIPFPMEYLYANKKMRTRVGQLYDGLWVLTVWLVHTNSERV